MATVVLVHGGFHGGWCWKKVQPLLQTAGHAVYTPTLTGLGERSHLLQPSVNLSTHIHDVVNVLVYEDLWDVVLVGHSYAGMVIAGVAEAAPERLHRLVYLDAVVPRDGESFFSATPPELRQRWRDNAMLVADTPVYPPTPQPWSAILSGWQVTDAADVAWMAPRLTPHPIAAMEEPVRLSADRAGQVPAGCILCTDTKRSSGAFAERACADAATAQADPAWHYSELDTSHEAMILAPEALTTILLRIAGEVAER